MYSWLPCENCAMRKPPQEDVAEPKDDGNDSDALFRPPVSLESAAIQAEEVVEDTVKKWLQSLPFPPPVTLGVFFGCFLWVDHWVLEVPAVFRDD